MMKAFLYLTVLTLLALSFQTHSMMRALNTAATGMAAQETSLSTISNNIANVNTIGYKKQRTEFETLAYETIIEAGSKSSNDSQYNVGLQIGSGSKVSAVRKQFSQGVPQITNNPFDLMINGEGFFGVLLPNQETRYTRDGSFNVNNQGTIVNKQGYKLLPVIQVPPNTLSVNISETGNIEAFVRNQTEPVNLGTLPVFTFINPVGLKSTGGNLYAMTSSSGAPASNVPGQSKSGFVQQGALESSNVTIMNEMNKLIKTQRGFEMNQRVIKTADEMLQTVNAIR